MQGVVLALHLSNQHLMDAFYLTKELSPREVCTIWLKLYSTERLTISRCSQVWSHEVLWEHRCLLEEVEGWLTWCNFDFCLWIQPLLPLPRHTPQSSTVVRHRRVKGCLGPLVASPLPSVLFRDLCLLLPCTSSMTESGAERLESSQAMPKVKSKLPSQARTFRDTSKSTCAWSSMSNSGSGQVMPYTSKKGPGFARPCNEGVDSTDIRSATDALEPKHAIPYDGKMLSEQSIDLEGIVEPRWTESTASNSGPERDMPNASKNEPKQARLRKDMKGSRWKRSSIGKNGSEHVRPDTNEKKSKQARCCDNRSEPDCARSRIGMLKPDLPSPATDKLAPIRVWCFTDMDGPIVPRSKGDGSRSKRAKPETDATKPGHMKPCNSDEKPGLMQSKMLRLDPKHVIP